MKKKPAFDQIVGLVGFEDKHPTEKVVELGVGVFALDASHQGGSGCRGRRGRGYLALATTIRMLMLGMKQIFPESGSGFGRLFGFE